MKNPSQYSEKKAILLLSLLVFATIPAMAKASEQDRGFNPAEYDAQLNAEHFNRDPGHVITVRKIVSAVEEVNRGRVLVNSYTIVLECKRLDVVSMTRCDPCEYPISDWVKRPQNVWFMEKSWHRGSTVVRARALRRADHFNNYFDLQPMQGTEHGGIVYQFWRFNGRRPTPLEVRHPPRPIIEGLEDQVAKEWDDIADVEIRYGDARPEKVTTPVGERSIRLTARAYTDAHDGRRLTNDFWPFWSSDCGEFTKPSGMDAMETTFHISENADTCNVYLYEARTGKRRKLIVERGKEPAPPIRVAITFEGGREGDGVILSGTGRWVDLEAHAYNPEGESIIGFTPVWTVESGRIEHRTESRTSVRVHVDEHATQTMVTARHEESGAEAGFEIRIGD